MGMRAARRKFGCTNCFSHIKTSEHREQAVELTILDNKLNFPPYKMIKILS